MLLILLSAAFATEDPSITAHLLQVADTLRQETPGSLPPDVRARRLDLLDALEQYALVGDFPAGPIAPSLPNILPPRSFNPSDREYRAPVFVDDAGTHCAAGYLIAVDAPEIASRIRAQDNGGYVLELAVPGLAEWAFAHGFSAEELAWIQPSYDARLPTCDNFDTPRGTYPRRDTCDGVRLSLDFSGRLREHRGCVVCNESATLWLPVWNTGTTDAVDVRVDLFSAENFITTQGLTPFVESRCGLAIPAGTGIAVGPIELSDFRYVQDGIEARFFADNLCSGANDLSFQAFGNFDMGVSTQYFQPEECGETDAGDTGHGTPYEGEGDELPVVAGVPCPPPDTDIDTDTDVGADTDLEVDTPDVPDDTEPSEDTDTVRDTDDTEVDTPPTPGSRGCDHGRPATPFVFAMAVAAVASRRRIRRA